MSKRPGKPALSGDLLALFDNLYRIPCSLENSNVKDIRDKVAGTPGLFIVIPKTEGTGLLYFDTDSKPPYGPHGGTGVNDIKAIYFIPVPINSPNTLYSLIVTLKDIKLLEAKK